MSDGHDFPFGSARDLARDFPAGPRGFLRRYEGDSVPLSLRLHQAGPRARAAFAWSRSDREAPWFELPLHRHDGQFRALLALPGPGSYLGRVRYSLDGQQWLWDPADYTHILVDPAACRGVRLYSFVPRVSGPLTRWPEHLRRAADLGFNFVHFLPLTEMDYSLSPYAAVEHFRVDPRYADPDDRRSPEEQFDAVIDTCRELGLRVCVDLVLNHVGVNHRQARRHPDWLQVDPAEADGIKRAGWQGESWHKWDDLALLEYEHPHRPTRRALWEHMIDYALYWARFAGNGGMIRLDNLHSSHADFLGQLLDRLHAEYPELLVWGELFDSHERVMERVLEYRLNLLLSTQWEHHFVPQLRSYLEHLHQHGDQLRNLTPLVSHDSGAVPEEFGDVRATVPRYVLAALLGLGQTGMVQGAEYGQAQHLRFIGEVEARDWPAEARFAAFLRQVHQLLEQYDVFHQAGNLAFVDNRHDAVLAVLREDQHESFLIAANLDIFHRQTLAVDTREHPWLATARFRDLLGGQVYQGHDERLELSLDSCEALVLRREA